MSNQIKKSELEMLKKKLAVKAVKPPKKKSIPKGDIEQYARIPFNDYVAVQRLIDSIDHDTVVKRLGSVENSDDLISLMAVEYIMNHAPTDIIKKDIEAAVKNGSSIQEITEYACKEMQRSVDERKFESMLEKFCADIRKKADRQILSKLRHSAVKEKLEKTSNPDELAALYVTTWLVDKFKDTDPDLEQIMLDAIDNASDFKNLAESGMFRYFENVPETIRKSRLEELKVSAFKRAENQFWDVKSKELGTKHIYTWAGLAWRTLVGTLAATTLTAGVLFSVFIDQNKEYHAKFWRQLPVKTQFDSKLRDYLDAEPTLEDITQYETKELPGADEEAAALYQKIVAMDELSGTPRRPDEKLIDAKIDALLDYAKDHKPTQQSFAALEKAALMIYINRDVTDADLVEPLEQMMKDYAEYDVLTEEKISNIVERYMKVQELSAEGDTAQQKQAAVVQNAYEWLQSVQEQAKDTNLGRELSFMFASIYGEQIGVELIQGSALKNVCKQARSNIEEKKDIKEVIALYAESMQGSHVRAARACYLIGFHFEQKKNLSNMIKWYKKSIAHLKKAEQKTHSASTKHFVSRAYLALGKASIEARYYEQANAHFTRAERLEPGLARQIEALKTDPESKRADDFWESLGN